MIMPRFIKKYKSQLNYDFVLGYLAHLITDKYWYGNNFISTKMFNSERCELSKACSNLISRYHISRLELPSNFVNPIEELESSGIMMTIDYLNSVNYLEDKDSTFDIDELMVCIDKTSDFVVSELIRLKKDAEN